MTYYNDIDAGACAWLRELMADGFITEGAINDRSIADISADDLLGHTRAHLFAGIGGWDYALQLAGWPKDEPVWTGSCPCQPFSCAGKRKGADDERHVWPQFRRLISECRPATIFGEQVAGRDGLRWLAGVRADLEALGYAVGAADLCAASVGAPHIRQRLYWVAHLPVERLLSAALAGLREEKEKRRARDGEFERRGSTLRPADADDPRSQGRHERRHGADELPTWPAGMEHWRDSIYIPCADGKARRTQPGIFPLAHGISGRVGLLRGAGNAIVPQVAAMFIAAYRAAREEG